jgi:uncharacterized protein DUF3570
MRRIFLTAAAMIALVQSYAQTADTSSFKSRKLKIEEVNLVSSYYHQEGNNAAVTGGTGSQALTDLSNVIDIKLIIFDKKLRKHTIGAEIGVDHYSSASSDRIDLKANSSPSTTDTRLYPALSWSRENEKKGVTIGAGLSYSSEYDYQSFGANVTASFKTHDRNGEFTASLQSYFDRVKKVSLSGVHMGASPLNNLYAGDERNTVAGSLSYTQIINKQLQVMFIADVIYQSGYLAMPIYRVYFADGNVYQENLPADRLKVPLAVRASYFLSDKIILKGSYRFYKDDWGVQSHTASIEAPLKITPFLSVSPFYRYYTQNASKYFAGFREHTASDAHYTSNYDLSKFHSSFMGAGLRIAPPKGVLGIRHFSMLEVRYGHYAKNIDMNANVITLNLKGK